MKASYLVLIAVLVCGCDDSSEMASPVPQRPSSGGSANPDFGDPEVVAETLDKARIFSEKSYEVVRGRDRYINPETGEPATGWIKKIGTEKFKGVPAGNVEWLGHYHEGIRNGAFISWWPTNPDWKTSQGQFADGKKEGKWFAFYSDGKTASESIYSAGKLTSVVVSKPNGETCPESGIDEKGNGLVVTYFEDGKGGIAASSRQKYRNFEWALD